MWIHVPTTLLVSAQDTTESSLDSERLSMLEQSATWKTKYLSPESWQRVWKRDTSIRRLSGLTSKTSTLNRGVEKWISSLEDFPVSPFQWQEKSSEKMTREISGQIQPDLYGDLGYQSSFWKMSADPSSSDTTTLEYDLNWSRWILKLRRDYSRRLKSAPRTEGVEPSYWPTPMHRDYKGMDGPGKKNALKDPRLYLSIPQVPRTNRDGHNCSRFCQRLNPVGAEHLMGLPLKWTYALEPLATESYRQWRLGLLGYLRRN